MNDMVISLLAQNGLQELLGILEAQVVADALAVVHDIPIARQSVATKAVRLNAHDAVFARSKDCFFVVDHFTIPSLLVGAEAPLISEVWIVVVITHTEDQATTAALLESACLLVDVTANPLTSLALHAIHIGVPARVWLEGVDGATVMHATRDNRWLVFHNENLICPRFAGQLSNLCHCRGVTVSPRQFCRAHANFRGWCANCHAAVQVVYEAVGLCSDVHFAVPSLLPAYCSDASVTPYFTCATLLSIIL